MSLLQPPKRRCSDTLFGVEPQVGAGDNPEIERMWAANRIEQLLKSADRTGSREAVVNQIVTVGEAYSIATEYTSFIVLENDDEYRRWKIDRRNASRLSGDRDSSRRLQKRLEALRDESLAKLGPAPAAAGDSQASTAPPSTPTWQPAKKSNSVSTPEPSSGLLMLLGAGWLLSTFRRRNKR